MDIQNEIAKIQNSAVNDPRFKKNEEVVITPEAVHAVEAIFASMLPHFPAWRQTCPTDEDLGRLKAAWTKAIIRHSRKTGKKPNFKAGVIACEESDSDWLPSVGKFLKWCEQEGDLTQHAQSALDLFNSAQKQIDSVGQMVVSKHAFDLKQMKAADTNKRFIELYLSYAENNAIEPLEAFALTETVQLSPEQKKDAEKRTEDAKNEFFSKFNQFRELNPEIPAETTEKALGIKQGSLKAHNKSKRELEEERERQLKAIGLNNG